MMAEPTVKTIQASQVYETSKGAQIFRTPMQAFPFLWVNAYLVLVDKMVVLIDAGSGFGESNVHLEAGLEFVSHSIGRKIGFEDMTHILITHGHIDHFGGLSYICDRSEALIGIHELDLGILTSYEERVATAEAHLKQYLLEAGVENDQRETILDMYRLNKALFHSLKVNITYKAINLRLGPFEMLHVPGHCAGQVVIRLHDVLFSGDHILGRITPHQSPEQLTLNTGLGHYLDSLEMVKNWAGNPSLTLAGHDDPIKDLPGRINEIRQGHASRLTKTLEILEEPRTIADVSAALFGEVSGYDKLLAIEEAGAHVEYLHQLGLLRIVEVSDPESQTGHATFHYLSVRDPVTEKIRLF